MKLLKKLIGVAGLAVLMAGNAQAGVVLNNWKFNPVGSGSATATTVNEYLDIKGNAFIQLTPTSATTFDFVEHGTFKITGYDGVSDLGPGEYITATFASYGKGSFSGAFHFEGGEIKMYATNTSQYGTTTGIFGANVGTNIATFAVQFGGGGNVDGTGNPVSNGQVSVFAKSTAPAGMLPGYFFRGNNSDLSYEDILSFAFTGANGVSVPASNFVTEVACDWAGYAGPGCVAGSYAAVPGQHLIVSNSGSFKLAEVPEPGSLALFGIAMLGAGVVSRKRSKQA